MSDPQQVAETAVASVAQQLGFKVDPQMVAQLAGFIIGAVTQDKWADAVKAGLARAERVKDVASAEAAAVERNR